MIFGLPNNLPCSLSLSDYFPEFHVIRPSLSPAFPSHGSGVIRLSLYFASLPFPINNPFFRITCRTTVLVLLTFAPCPSSSYDPLCPSHSIPCRSYELPFFCPFQFHRAFVMSDDTPFFILHGISHVPIPCFLFFQIAFPMPYPTPFVFPSSLTCHMTLLSRFHISFLFAILFRPS